MSRTDIQIQVSSLVEAIVAAAMTTDYKEAMAPFADVVSPQMEHMIKSVFEAGVRIGASEALVSVLGAAKESK